MGKQYLQLQYMKKITTIVLFTCLFKINQAQVVIALLFGDKLNTGTLEFGIVVTPGFTGLSNIESERRTNLSLGIYFNIHPDKTHAFDLRICPRCRVQSGMSE